LLGIGSRRAEETRGDRSTGGQKADWRRHRVYFVCYE
jgi:hypothetical protein